MNFKYFFYKALYLEFANFRSILINKRALKQRGTQKLWVSFPLSALSDWWVHNGMLVLNIYMMFASFRKHIFIAIKVETGIAEGQEGLPILISHLFNSSSFGKVY